MRQYIFVIAIAPANPLNVLHVYRTYYPATQGGLEETIRQLCVTTQAHGVRTRVLAPVRDPSKKIVRYSGSRVYQPRLNFELASCSVSWESIAMYKRLQGWADIVHYHFPWPFADVLHELAPPGVPTVLTYHSDIVRQKVLSQVYKPLMNRFLRSVDRIVCTSPNYFATSDVLQKFSDKVEVIPIGLNESVYPKPTPSQLARVEATYGRDFFLFVGVLRYYKGLHILLEAMKDAPYRVVIVGSGPTEMELKRQAETLGLRNVHFAGHVSDTDKVCLFNLSRAIVFPSYLRTEAFGVTLLEGAMSSKPLISTEVGSGTSHVNADQETGLVIPPGSSAALRQAMDHLYRNPERAARMGVRARARFEKLFTGELMAQRYVDVYSKLLARRASIATKANETAFHRR